MEGPALICWERQLFNSIQLTTRTPRCQVRSLWTAHERNLISAPSWRISSLYPTAQSCRIAVPNGISPRSRLMSPISRARSQETTAVLRALAERLRLSVLGQPPADLLSGMAPGIVERPADVDL